MDSKRKIVAGVAGVAMLACAGGVYAATNDGGDKEREAFTDNVAKRLDVSPAKLKSAVQGAFEDRLDAAVKDGKLTQKQADEIKKKIKEHGGVPFGPGFGFGGPGGPDGPKGFGGERGFHVRGHGPGASPEVAKYLGLSEEALEKQLRSGKSLADVAKAQDKDTAGLKKAMRAGIEAKLDKAVKNEDLTDKQRDEIVKNFDEHLDDVIAGKPPKGFKRFGPGRPGGPKFEMHFKDGDGPSTARPAGPPPPMPPGPPGLEF